MKRILVFLALALYTGCSVASQEICIDANQQTQKIKRQPLPKSDFVLKSPTKYLNREKQDSKTGRVTQYDPKPQIVPVDEKTGKYHLRWIGYDGKIKTILYQRADAIDAIVTAVASKNDKGKYSYVYSIQNLPSSHNYLSHFVVQNFASDVEPMKMKGMHVGQMFNAISQFSKGRWLSFAPLSEIKEQFMPGTIPTIFLTSSSLPGFVECRITGGELTLKGVGEHMPYELESAMGGYKEFPLGYTIGPIDKLKNMTKEERAKYLLDLLPKLQEIGWITDEVKPCYQQMLGRNDLPGALKKAEQDLKAERIAGEVYYMIEGLNQ